MIRSASPTPNIQGGIMTQYRHTVTFVTEINEKNMSGFTLMNWLGQSERARYNIVKDSNLLMLKDMIREANKNGSWAIVKVVDNG